ncbi:hypothetical protein DFS34DRAFT_625622 [Phlyctochytrium arcticum]|nr:hypothetical protein DFS34DRAFT_625622 [Phlyctochytrium arcticum]
MTPATHITSILTAILCTLDLIWALNRFQSRRGTVRKSDPIPLRNSDKQDVEVGTEDQVESLACRDDIVPPWMMDIEGVEERVEEKRKSIWGGTPKRNSVGHEEIRVDTPESWKDSYWSAATQSDHAEKAEQVSSSGHPPPLKMTPQSSNISSSTVHRPAGWPRTGRPPIPLTLPPRKPPITERLALVSHLLLFLWGVVLVPTQYLTLPYRPAIVLVVVTDILFLASTATRLWGVLGAWCRPLQRMLFVTETWNHTAHILTTSIFTCTTIVYILGIAFSVSHARNSVDQELSSQGLSRIRIYPLAVWAVYMGWMALGITTGMLYRIVCAKRQMASMLRDPTHSRQGSQQSTGQGPSIDSETWRKQDRPDDVSSHFTTQSRASSRFKRLIHVMIPSWEPITLPYLSQDSSDRPKSVIVPSPLRYTPLDIPPLPAPMPAPPPNDKLDVLTPPPRASSRGPSMKLCESESECESTSSPDRSTDTTFMTARGKSSLASSSGSYHMPSQDPLQQDHQPSLPAPPPPVPSLDQTSLPAPPPPLITTTTHQTYLSQRATKSTDSLATQTPTPSLLSPCLPSQLPSRPPRPPHPRPPLPHFYFTHTVLLTSLLSILILACAIAYAADPSLVAEGLADLMVPVGFAGVMAVECRIRELALL